MMRQICKQILTIALLLGFATASARGEGVVTAIVTDPLTGVALEGYDPVSYFTEAEPQQGRPDFEYQWAGVPWYFVSAANRDIFKRAPDVYAPQHGGYCEMSLARGYLSDGKPKIYAIEKMKLYLFYSAANREAFLLQREQAISAAQVSWETLRKNLVGAQPAQPTAAVAALPGADAAVAKAASH